MLDKYFWKKENKIKRNYDIEDHLFEKMKGATQVYDASVADIFNACIMELIESQDIELNKRDGSICSTYFLYFRKQRGRAGKAQRKIRCKYP